MLNFCYHAEDIEGPLHVQEHILAKISRIHNYIISTVHC